MRLLFLRFLGFGLALLLFSSKARAQAPSFETVIAIGASSTGTAALSNTATDALGNRYVIGSFQGSVAFGSTTLTSANNQNIFVAKLDPTGTYVWAVQAGGADSDGGTGIAVDGSGSVYVTGSYGGPATFGTLPLASSTPTPFGYSDAFVGRLDAAGNWLWVRGAGGSKGDNGGPVVLDGIGNVYFAASFTSLTAQFGPFTVANVDPLAVNISDFVIAKLDAAGNWRWVRSGGSGGYDWVRNLALDGSGRLFAYGSFEGNSLALGPLTVANAGSGSNDVYITQLDTAGTWQWARSAGGTFIDYDGGMALDQAGNAYVAGSFRSPSMGFGAIVLPSHSGTSQIMELFVAKINGSGTWQWATAASSATNIINSVAVSSTGDVVVTGSFSSASTQLGGTLLANNSTVGPNGANLSDAFLARLDPAGNWLGATSSQGPGSEAGLTVAFDPAGNLLTSGFFQGATATFGATTLTGNSNTAISYLSFVPTSLLRVNNLTPRSASAGQTVTVTGSGFSGATAVLFNGLPAASFAVQSATRLTAMVPAGATAGPVSVRNGSGSSNSPIAFQPVVLATFVPFEKAAATWPNPVGTAEALQIRLPEPISPVSPVQLELRNALGQMVRTMRFSGSQASLPMRGVAPGLYHLLVRPAGQPAIRQKVVVAD